MFKKCIFKTTHPSGLYSSSSVPVLSLNIRLTILILTNIYNYKNDLVLTTLIISPINLSLRQHNHLTWMHYHILIVSYKGILSINKTLPYTTFQTAKCPSSLVFLSFSFCCVKLSNIFLMLKSILNFSKLLFFKKPFFWLILLYSPLLLLPFFLSLLLK